MEISVNENEKEATSDKFEESHATCICTCHTKEKKKSYNMGEIVNEIIERNLKKGKTVIRLEIEVKKNCNIN